MRANDVNAVTVELNVVVGGRQVYSGLTQASMADVQVDGLYAMTSVAVDKAREIVFAKMDGSARDAATN